MKNEQYYCPMHPEVTSNKPGNCPKCGMSLVKPGEKSNHSNSTQDSYWPLGVIISIITVVTLTLGVRDYLAQNFSFSGLMSYLMAGFFLTFSGFKFLDLKGFAQGYSTYDLLAQKIFSYGYIYPFLEFFLGIAYLLGVQNNNFHIFTFILMGFSGLGVLDSMLKKRKFQCACLGTFIKLPLTKVTLVEDFGMALMAFLMFVLK